MRGISLTLAVAFAASIPAAAVATTVFKEKPAWFEPGKVDGAAAWLEKGLVQIHFTSTDEEGTRYEVIVCGAEDANGVQLEAKDTARGRLVQGFDGHGGCYGFELRTHKGVDGIAVKPLGETVHLRIKIDGKLLNKPFVRVKRHFAETTEGGAVALQLPIRGLRWVSWKAGGRLIHRTVYASPKYEKHAICRAAHKDFDRHPGQLIEGACHIERGGKTHALTKGIEVLVGQPLVQWLKWSRGKPAPARAVLAGHDGRRQLAVCRGRDQKRVLYGGMLRKAVCHIARQGKVWRPDEYEVLIEK